MGKLTLNYKLTIMEDQRDIGEFYMRCTSQMFRMMEYRYFEQENFDINSENIIEHMRDKGFMIPSMTEYEKVVNSDFRLHDKGSLILGYVKYNLLSRLEKRINYYIQTKSENWDRVYEIEWNEIKEEQDMLK